jgi:hypothetical protein
MASEVVLKDCGAQWIVSLREVIPGSRTIGTLFGKLYGALGPLASQGLAAVVFHDLEFKEQEVDVEVGVCLNHPVSRTTRCHRGQHCPSWPL